MSNRIITGAVAITAMLTLGFGSVAGASTFQQQAVRSSKK